MVFAFIDDPTFFSLAERDPGASWTCVSMAAVLTNSKSRHLFVSIRSQFLKCWLPADRSPAWNPVPIMDGVSLRWFRQGLLFLLSWKPPPSLAVAFPAFPGHMTQHILGRELSHRCCEACGQSQAGLWARLLCASPVHVGVSFNPKVTSLTNLIFSLYLGRRGVCNGCNAV